MARLGTVTVSYINVAEPLTLGAIREDTRARGWGGRDGRPDEVLMWQHQLDWLKKLTRGDRAHYYLEQPVRIKYTRESGPYPMMGPPGDVRRVLETETSSPSTIFGVPIRVLNPDGRP